VITILGTGLLGSGFAHALRRQGESVHVWNRSPDKARALAEIGGTELPLAMSSCGRSCVSRTQ